MRRCSDWISSYLRFTENSEPPLQYNTWTSLFLLGAALQRKVFVQWEEKIYPNQYIILVGNSGATRKGVTLGKARRFLEDIPTIYRETGSRVTKEQLVIDLAKSYTTYELHDTIYFQSAVSQIAPELSVFLGSKDILLLSWLTDWYDCLPMWENRTKTAGIDVVENMCYNLLAGTAPDWLNSMIPNEAMGGGFTSRCMFVYEERKRKIVADPRPLPHEEALYEDLLKDLIHIHENLKGEFTVSPEFLHQYFQWYEDQEAQILDGYPPIKDNRFSGYIARRQTHCWKASMLFSVSRSDTLILEESDFFRARTMIEATEKKMPYVFGGRGTGRYGEILYKILEYIMERGEVKHSELLRQHKYDLDDYTLRLIVDNLKKMFLVAQVHEGEDPLDSTYTYIESRQEEP